MGKSWLWTFKTFNKSFFHCKKCFFTCSLAEWLWILLFVISLQKLHISLPPQNGKSLMECLAHQRRLLFVLIFVISKKATVVVFNKKFLSYCHKATFRLDIDRFEWGNFVDWVVRGMENSINFFFLLYPSKLIDNECSFQRNDKMSSTLP